MRQETQVSHVCVSGYIDVRVLLLTFSYSSCVFCLLHIVFTNVLVFTISFCHCISSGGLDIYVKLCFLSREGRDFLSTVP